MRLGPEFDLIAAIRERLGITGADASAVEHVVGIGDDAAVTVPAGATATSIDALVEGVHFRSAWCPPRAIGHKALATALSDLAAMGAGPGEAYVWLGRPESLGSEDCLELAAGIGELASELGVAVLGGDLTAAPVIAIAVTVVGHAAGAGELVGRAGAGEGDAVCVTGELGGAAAGLMLLEHPELGEGLDPAACEELRARQLTPQPLLAAGLALARAGASSMIDISDGLGADAGHLAAASGLGIEINMERVPVGPGVEALAAAAGHGPLEFVASGGEDYELLCTLPRDRLEAARGVSEAVGAGLTEIGTVEAAPGVRLRLPGGRVLRFHGHDHLDR